MCPGRAPHPMPLAPPLGCVTASCAPMKVLTRLLYHLSPMPSTWHRASKGWGPVGKRAPGDSAKEDSEMANMGPRGRGAEGHSEWSTDVAGTMASIRRPAGDRLAKPTPSPTVGTVGSPSRKPLAQGHTRG